MARRLRCIKTSATQALACARVRQLLLVWQVLCPAYNRAAHDLWLKVPENFGQTSATDGVSTHRAFLDTMKASLPVALKLQGPRHAGLRTGSNAVLKPSCCVWSFKYQFANGVRIMFKRVSLALMSAIVALFAATIFAQAQDPIQDALTGCAKELNEFCSTVKPGKGRLVACMKAHDDKLSSQCVSALNRADFRLSSSALALRYVGLQCKADALKHCPNVKIGEGRVLDCLAENKSKTGKDCSIALRDVGVIQ